MRMKKPKENGDEIGVCEVDVKLTERIRVATLIFYGVVPSKFPVDVTSPHFTLCHFT